MWSGDSRLRSEGAASRLAATSSHQCTASDSLSLSSRAGGPDFQQPPFAPLQTCPNFFLVETEEGGIGHRASALAVAIDFAVRTQSAILLDDAFFRDGVPDRVYPNLRALLNLDAFLFSRGDLALAAAPSSRDTTQAVNTTTWGQLSVGPADSTVQRAVRAARSGCHQILRMPSGMSSCELVGREGKQYCMLSGLTGPLQRARPIMRSVYLAGRSARLPLQLFQAIEERQLKVAWHVRNGDVALHDDAAYWTKTVSALVAAFSHCNISAKHYIFAEKPILPDGPFSFLFNMSHFAFQLMPGEPADSTFRHLAAADMLVHSGSSFTYVAGMVASANQISVFAPPKESQVIGDTAYEFYHLDGSIPLQTDGSISAGHAATLERRLQAWQSGLL